MAADTGIVPADRMDPVLALLRRAANAEEPHVRQNAIHAWAALIAQQGGTATEPQVADLVEAMISVAPDSPAVVDDFVLRTAQEGLNKLPPKLLGEATAQLYDATREDRLPGRTARAAWLLLAVWHRPGSTAPAGRGLRRLLFYRKLTRMAGRPLRRGFSELTLGLILVMGIWVGANVLTAMPLSLADLSDASGALAAAGFAIMIVSAWLATPRALLQTRSDRVLEALKCAIVSAIVASVVVWSFGETADGGLEPIILVFLSLFAGLLAARFAGPGRSGLAASGLAQTAAASLIGCVVVFVVGLVPSRGLPDSTAVLAPRSNWWTMVPLLAGAGLGLGWADGGRMPGLRRLREAQADRVEHRSNAIRWWTPIVVRIRELPEFLELRAAIGEGGFGRWLIALWICAAAILSLHSSAQSIARLDAEKSLGVVAGASCTGRDDGRTSRIVSDIILGRSYAFQLCGSGDLGILALVAGPTGEFDEYLSLYLYDNAEIQLDKARGKLPLAIVRNSPDSLKGRVCLGRDNDCPKPTLYIGRLAALGAPGWPLPTSDPRTALALPADTFQLILSRDPGFVGAITKRDYQAAVRIWKTTEGATSK
jgi:hypothetical protein